MHFRWTQIIILAPHDDINIDLPSLAILHSANCQLQYFWVQLAATSSVLCLGFFSFFPQLNKLLCQSQTVSKEGIHFKVLDEVSGDYGDFSGQFQKKRDSK